MVERETHAHGAAEGEAAEGDPVELERVEQRHDLRGDPVDAARVEERRPAVARVVEADDAKAAERRQLLLPHRQRRAERASQHEDGLAIAVDAVVEGHRSRS